MPHASKDAYSAGTLNELYQRIHECTLCIGAHGCAIAVDPDRIQRREINAARFAQVFLVGQGLAKDTQRKSGVPYHLPSGVLSRTGKRLERFLQLFGYSIEPDGSGQYVYSSDIVQHFTGRAGSGDRVPTAQERANCAPWLQRELEFIQPKVIVCLGRVAAMDIMARYGDGRFDGRWGVRHRCTVGGRRVAIFCVPHPSYRFGGMDTLQTYDQTAKAIRDILGEEE